MLKLNFKLNENEPTEDVEVIRCRSFTVQVLTAIQLYVGPLMIRGFHVEPFN